MLHKLPSGKSAAGAPEGQLNDFLEQSPELRALAAHMNTALPLFHASA
jgi:hypothetical protein